MGVMHSILHSTLRRHSVNLARLGTKRGLLVSLPTATVEDPANPARLLPVLRGYKYW